MGIVFAVISGKGGVGKTTTTANLGIGIANEGKKTVVVDFDLGQRNLDMILGLENRVIYDMVHVMDKESQLRQALIKSKHSDKLYFLAASQTKDKTALEREKVRKLIADFRSEFEYVILDAPAGIESGFEHTIMFADATIVVVNPEVSSIRDADKAIGIVDSKCERVKQNKHVQKYLIINRINPEMVTNGEMLESNDILDILDIDLVGKIPEDKKIVEASNTGRPVILDDKSPAGAAYRRISRRLCGIEEEFPDVEKVQQASLMDKIKGLFQ
ncbi:MAG: septum site-determining protein MinD [Epsilonproteobacteria bacterium]|nr:MAG: septum site-determining protein MinD [Campylobacterota bacterium]